VHGAPIFKLRKNKTSTCKLTPLMPSAGIPMFINNQTRSFHSVPFSTDRVKRKSINLTRTSPTHEPATAPGPNQEVVRRESLNTGTKRPHYSKQHKEAIIRWCRKGYNETAIAAKFRTKFPDGRKITTAMVSSCLHRWGAKGTATIEDTRELGIHASNPSDGVQAKPRFVIHR